VILTPPADGPLLMQTAKNGMPVLSSSWGRGRPPQQECLVNLVALSFLVSTDGAPRPPVGTVARYGGFSS
jgi:hypothetical protein